MYLSFNEAAKFCCMSRARIEQLIRDETAEFPRPLQPHGTRGRRRFKRADLVAWIERRPAQQNQGSN
jgi:excisionase family DNA binding protein